MLLHVQTILCAIVTIIPHHLKKSTSSITFLDFPVAPFQPFNARRRPTVVIPPKTFPEFNFLLLYVSSSSLSSSSRCCVMWSLKFNFALLVSCELCESIAFHWFQYGCCGKIEPNELKTFKHSPTRLAFYTTNVMKFFLYQYNLQLLDLDVNKAEVSHAVEWTNVEEEFCILDD